MSYEEIIKEAALDLSVGETTHKTPCPWCGGGDSKEQAFNITRKDPFNLVYKCHRLTCSKAGAVHSRSEGEFRTQPQFEPNFYSKSLLSLVGEQLVELCDKYYFHPLDIPTEWKYAPEDNALAMPAHNFADVCTGLMLKRWPGSPQKIITYLGYHQYLKNMYYPYFRNSKFAYYPAPGVCVVTEDQISAVKCRVVSGCAALALLGTHMNDQLAAMLATHHKRVIVALDPDTWTTRDPVFFRLSKRHGGAFDSFIGLRLPKDPKDLPRRELKELLNEYL